MFRTIVKWLLGPAIKKIVRAEVATETEDWRDLKTGMQDYTSGAKAQLQRDLLDFNADLKSSLLRTVTDNRLTTGTLVSDELNEVLDRASAKLRSLVWERVDGIENEVQETLAKMEKELTEFKTQMEDRESVISALARDCIETNRKIQKLQELIEKREMTMAEAADYIETEELRVFDPEALGLVGTKDDPDTMP